MPGVASVFRIHQGKETTITAEPVDKADQPASDPQSGEEPSVASQSTQEVRDEAKGKEAGKERPELVVKVEGPVGQVFTDALNKVLAKESIMMTDLPAITAQDPETKPVSIHVYDAGELKLGDVEEVHQVVADDENVEHVVVLESAINGSKAAALMNAMAGAYKNVTVCLSTESAISHLRGKYHV